MHGAASPRLCDSEGTQHTAIHGDRSVGRSHRKDPEKKSSRKQTTTQVELISCGAAQANPATIETVDITLEQETVS